MIILLSISFYSNILAQDSVKTHGKKRYIEITAGYYRTGLLDKSFSPLLFIGNGENISMVYNSTSNKSLNKIELQVAYIPLYPEDNSIQNEFKYLTYNQTETYHTYPWEGIGAILSYEHLRKLNLKNPKMDLFVGGIFDNFFPIIYPRAWIVSYSIGPKATVEYLINQKHKISTSFHFPVFSLVERPPYASWNDDVIYNPNPVLSRFYSGKPMLPNDYFYSKLSVDYQYTISKRLCFTVLYKYAYYKCNKNREYISITNILNLGILYKI